MELETSSELNAEEKRMQNIRGEAENDEMPSMTAQKESETERVEAKRTFLATSAETEGPTPPPSTPKRFRDQSDNYK